MEFLAIVVVLVALVGCTVFEGREDPPPVVAHPEDAVALRLAAAAGRAEEALGRLSRIEASREPIDWSAPPELVPEELMVGVTLEWSGPIGELAAHLAKLAGYEFVMVGAAPVLPVMVDVRAVGMPLIGVLRETGFQAGTRARVTVDTRRRVVELVHRGQ